MFPLLDFSTCSGEEEMVELAYQQFKQDFLDTPLYLANSLYIDPLQPPGRPNQKEQIFWHLIIRENKEHRRVFDPKRACRIGWIRQIILDYEKPHVKLFYYQDKKIRLYLWLYDFDFVVILQKSHKIETAFIVTGFYIDENDNKKTYGDRYKAYNNDLKLKSCAWF